MSTIKSIQPKEAREDLSEMGVARLWEELDKADGDSERFKMITRMLRARSIARATGEQQTLTAQPPIIETPAFASTPNDPTLKVGENDQDNRKLKLSWSEPSESIPHTASARQEATKQDTGGACDEPTNLGARPKTTIGKRDMHVSDNLSNEDRPSLEDTVESSFSSTAANRGPQNSISIPSSGEKPREVGFIGEQWKSCLKSQTREGVQSGKRFVQIPFAISFKKGEK